MSGRGILMVVSGPSGVGKSTIIRHMLDQRMNCCPCYFSVSMTTREPRPDEADGVHYLFASTESFEESIRRNEFLEYARYDKDYYGTPLTPITRCVDNGGCAILDIDVQGMRQVVKRWPDCVTVFITPPSMTELEKRLRERGTESEERVLKRLEIARRECGFVDEYQYLIINNIIESAARDLAAIVRAESLKMVRQPT